MPNLRPLPSLDVLLNQRPIAPAPAPQPQRPISLPPLSSLRPLQPLQPLQSQPLKPAQPAAQPMKAPQAMAVDNLWNLQAALNIFKADTNGDGKLNKEEYQSISLVQGDSYFASAARDYEFAVVDEIKFSDGQITMDELATFYQQMDTNKNGAHSQSEFQNRLSESSFMTKMRNPTAAFSQALSRYTNLVKDYVTGS